mgnify:CR=1 FL=1
MIKGKEPLFPGEKMADDIDFKPDRKRFEELFNELDKNKDGKIDVDELAQGLKKLSGRYTPGQAEVLNLEVFLLRLF